MFLCKWMVLAVLLYGYCWCETQASVCPAAPFRPGASPGTTVTTQCSSVHPSLNPRGAITWQCRPDFTWEGDWSGCTFPEGVGHAVAPLAYRVAAGESEVQNSIQTITSEVQALLQSVSLTTFGDIHVAYIGVGADSEETILVLTLQVDEFFPRDSFQRLETASSAERNFTLAGLLATPLWTGGPALRAYNLCNCPFLWSSLEPALAPGQPIVYLCTTPYYIEATCSCQDLLNDTTCTCTSAFETQEYPTLGRVCQFDPARVPLLLKIQSVNVTLGFVGLSPNADPSLEVSWSSVDNPDVSYVVRYSKSQGSPTEPPASARQMTTNHTNVMLADNLAEDKRISYRYYIWVAAQSAGVMGEYSDRASGVTLSSPYPRDVTVFPVGCQSLQVTWVPQAPTPPLTLLQYGVWYLGHGGGGIHHYSLRDGSSYTITDLTPATNYSVIVRAQTQLGYGDSCCSPTASTDNVSPPRMVTLEALTSQGAVRVIWSPPTDLCGLTNPQYIIQYGMTTSSSATHLSTPSSSPFSITGLAVGQQYFVRVAIRTQSGSGDFSSWQSVTINEASTNNAQVTSLDLKSLSGVTLETGNALVLMCQAGTDSNQAANFGVVWRLNGTILSNNNGLMTSFSNYTHYLQADPVFSSYSGTYSCELDSDAAVETSLSIKVNPGCFPHVFVPYTPIGHQLEVDCSQAHPSLRGVMWWRCVSDLIWDGELSGCTFEEDVDREVGLFHLLVSGNETVVSGKMSGIFSDMMARVNQTFDPATVYNLDTVEVNRFSHNWTLLVFALELHISSGSRNAFNALYMYMNNGQYLGGLATAPYGYLAGTLLIAPSDTCLCPIFYRDIQRNLTVSGGFKQLQFCKGPAYVKTPCLCTPFLSLSSDGCNCNGVYTMVEPMDGNVMCAEDTDGDGIPNSEDLCEGCCLGESSEGFNWPTLAHELESRKPCALLHPMFNEESYVRRRCSDKGKWMPVDVTQCVFKEAARFAVVIVVATVGATKEEIKQQAGNLTNQILTHFASYKPRNASISNYSPGSTGNQTVVTLFVEFPEDVLDDVIRVYSRPKRNLQIEGTPYVYGFRPANECACLPPGMEMNRSTLIEVCSGSPLSPCLCTVAGGCKCLDPFVFVNTSSDPHVKCSLDSDGDGIPDHLDAEPFRYSNSQVPPQENCFAVVPGSSCPVDTTSSPDISWSITTACMFDVQRCSKLLNETVGLAYRLCNRSGQWEEPDVRGCQSVAFRNIETTVNEVVTAILDTPTVAEGGTLELQPSHIVLLANTTQTLLNATGPSSSSGLLPGDLNIAVNYLNSLASISENTDLFSSANYTETSLFSVTSNILGAENEGSWEAITSMDNSSTNAAVSLFNSTERLTQSFAQNLSPGDSANFTSNNLVVEVWSVSNVSVQDLNVDKKETNNASVFISEDLLRQQENGTAVVVSFVSRLSNRLPQRFANQSFVNGSLTVIVSIQIGNMDQLPTLEKSPVHLQFENIADEATASCLFLDEQNGTGLPAVWSGAGLITNHSRANGVVTCTVHHLTGFAVLVSTAQVAGPHRYAFQWVSYIGCAISLLCLIATIIFLLTLRRELFKKLNNFVHLNLCIALACGLLIFLVGIEGAKSVDIACKIMAFLLHYFFLTAFFWMLCEAVTMYNLLVKVFHANERKWVYIYLALGWVTPLPIVVISVAIRHEQYLVKAQASDETIACWLSSVNGTIYAFIVPMLLTLLVNAILLTFVMWSLFKFYRDSIQRQFKADKAENEAKFLTWELFKAFIILLPLLGFTWIIGLFAVNEETTIFAWLFVILNSLQGAAIFFFYVLRNDKVRPKIVAFFKRFYHIRQYIYQRRVSFGVPPTESMQQLPTSSPDTARRNFTSLTTPTNTLQSNRSDSDRFESRFDTSTDHDPDEERDEVQEAVLTFEDDGHADSSSSSANPPQIFQLPSLPAAGKAEFPAGGEEYQFTTL